MYSTVSMVNYPACFLKEVADPKSINLNGYEEFLSKRILSGLMSKWTISFSDSSYKDSAACFIRFRSYFYSSANN